MSALVTYTSSLPSMYHLQHIYTFISRESRREKCEKAELFFIRYIQDDNVQNSTGFIRDLSVLLALNLRFLIIVGGFTDTFPIPSILICSQVLQENQERNESIFDCQNRSWDMHTHTYIHILNLFHTSHTSWREKIVTQSEWNLNSWQINTGWWIKLSK